MALPQYLAFFGDKRLVPIVTGLFALLTSVVAGYVWPTIQAGIDAFASGVAESGALGQFSYGTLNRALTPVGLHHVVSSFFWFGLGEFTNASGEVVTGDLTRFFAVDTTKGVFMAGFFPRFDVWLTGCGTGYVSDSTQEKQGVSWRYSRFSGFDVFLDVGHGTA